MTAHTLIAPNPPGYWRAPGLAFVAVLAALLWLYYPTGAAMVSIWMRSETYAHAFVVLPIVLWLVWRRRAELRDLRPTPMPWVLVPMLIAALVWLLSSLVAVNSIAQLSFTAMLVLAVPLVLGAQVTRMLAFPLAFIFFAVPIGEFLTPTMMQWTADFTVMALQASGIPVYREGLQFVIPSGSWSVVEACSGVRYLMASFMVGSLFAYLNYQSTVKRLVFVGVSLAMPIVANWLRAYMIVMLGHLSNNELATGADHLIYGWVFFGIVILAMFFIGARWAEPDAKPSTPTPPVKTGAAWPIALVAALLAAAPTVVLHRIADTPPGLAPVFVLPASLGAGWSAVATPVSDWRPVFVEASVEANQSYRSASGVVGVHIAYYRDQTETRKLVSSRNVLVRGEDLQWNHLRSAARTVGTEVGDIPVRTADLLGVANPGQTRQRLQVWQVYWVGGHLTTSDVMSKVFSAWQRLSGQADDSAALLFYASETASGGATPLLESFMRANFRTLASQLQATRATR